MPLEEKLLEKLKCCLHDDGHIAIEPLQLQCGGNACIKCIPDIKEESKKHSKCKKTCAKNDLINSILNEIALQIETIQI